MSGKIVRRLKPEEEELQRKRDQLAAIRTTLAERELDLVDLRTQLAAFEGRYLRQVGALYAEMDEWKARIAELQARLDPSAASKAKEAREQARQTYEDAHGQASESPYFVPSPELKRVYREAAKRIHPDFAADPIDSERRTRFMAEANRAYKSGDADALQRIIEEYEDGVENVKGEGIGAELIRIIRQISEAKERTSAIQLEMAALQGSEIAKLKQDAEEAKQQGRDLLDELATTVRQRIESLKNTFEKLSGEAKHSDG